MSCLTCSSFDPNYHGGYCDYHHYNVSPSESCRYEDSNGGGSTYRTCSTCESFDPYAKGGFCDYHKRKTYPSSTCSSYS